MQIFIPTMSRVNPVKSTLDSFDAGIRRSCHLVAPVSQYYDYLPMAHKYGCKLIAVPEAVQRIGPTRHFIGKWAQEHGIEKFIQMDDDIEFYIRRKQETDDDDWWKLTEPTPIDIAQMLDWVEDALDDYAHVGISGREGQNRVREAEVENTRYLRVLAYRTKEYMECEHERVAVMEDFDINLQLLRRGMASLTTYRWAQGQKKTQADGGCSTWRTHEVHSGGVRRLSELHPGFVRLRQKKNKTDAEGFGDRLEATIYWKKAYKSSQ